MIIRKIIFSCALIISITTIFMISSKFSHENKSQYLKFTGTIPLLVLHDGSKDTKTLKSIKNFKKHHQFLMVKVNNKYQFIRSLPELVPFANNKDNMINQSDKIYSQLYIASYNNKKNKYQYQPLSKTSIKAINLKPKKITANKSTLRGSKVSNQNHKSESYNLVFSTELFSKLELNNLPIQLSLK